MSGTTELPGNGLPVEEGIATPSVPASIPEPQPSEPLPQYVSRAEVLRLLEEVRAEAREHGQRGAQSFIDKTRLNERVSQTEKTLRQLVSDGLMDEAQASAYLRQAKMDALTDLLPEPEPQPQRVQSPPVGPPPGDPLAARAEQLVKESGLQPTDPEYQLLFGHDNPFGWYEALQNAKAARAARLAREAARQTAAPTPAAPPVPTPPAPHGATAVEVGGGPAAPAGDLNSLREQLRKAYRSGNRPEIKRLNDEIDRVLRSG